MNSIGLGIWALFIFELGKKYPTMAKLRFWCTNNMAEYEVIILGIRMSLVMNIQELVIIGDSDFMMHHVQGE